jgi:hypothetical protein
LPQREGEMSFTDWWEDHETMKNERKELAEKAFDAGKQEAKREFQEDNQKFLDALNVIRMVLK